MGMLHIRAWGSFGTQEKTFRAQTSGHAVCVEDAIRHLKDVVLPEAVHLDCTLRAEGHGPDDGFKEADERGSLK